MTEEQTLLDCRQMPAVARKPMDSGGGGEGGLKKTATNNNNNNNNNNSNNNNNNNHNNNSNTNNSNGNVNGNGANNQTDITNNNNNSNSYNNNKCSGSGGVKFEQSPAPLLGLKRGAGVATGALDLKTRFGQVSAAVTTDRKNKLNAATPIDIGGTTAASATAAANSDSEEGFLSTSPDSANGETSGSLAPTNGPASKTSTEALLLPSLTACNNKKECVSLRNILDSFKSPLSEEQAWALIFQLISLYRKVSNSAASLGTKYIFNDLEIPEAIENVNLHRDGSIHCSWSEAERKERAQIIIAQDLHKTDSKEDGAEENHALMLASHKKILRKVAVIVYTALDYNLAADEQCQMSQELEELISHMTADESEDDCIDEGIDEGYKRWDDENEDEKFNNTKELDFVLEACRNHVQPTTAEDHFKAVCRALVTETVELRIFLQQVLNNGADNLHAKVDSKSSKQELAKLGFTDWARFWVQVIDELRRGVRLKKSTYSRAPIEYQLTPYEILMEDIRTKKYQLRKVMVNGDIPPRVKKDAHALILEFIRSRPPLRKASERQLPPPVQADPSPREQLMDSIRKGQTLKHIPPPPQPRLKDRLLPAASATNAGATTSAPTTAGIATTKTKATTYLPTHTNEPLSAFYSLILEENMEPQTTSRSKQRLIKVDFSLLQDDDFFDEASFAAASSSAAAAYASQIVAPHVGGYAQPKIPPYPLTGYLPYSGVAAAAAAATASNNNNNINNNNHHGHGSGGSGTGSGHHHKILAAFGKMPSTQLPPPTRVLRKTNYDLASQSESRRPSSRRHTIVGCQSNCDESLSVPPSRPDSRQSDVQSNASDDSVAAPNQVNNAHSATQAEGKRSQSPDGGSSSSIGPWNKSFMDEKTWNERGDDRLSLTLEEIVHIRSVMTKAELEGLPVGVRVREDVEKRKVCFLCLRTRFSIFGPWGIMCKLCQRTVCSKCYTKMRIPSEHFRNVPLVLISPSLLASPAGSSTPSPSHQAHHSHSASTGNILDETFPKSLIERLLRSESDRKTRHTVGSAPSSPKHQRSNMSTPGMMAAAAAAGTTGQAVEALHDESARTMAASAYASMGNGGYGQLKESASVQAQNRCVSAMSRSMEGPRSLPVSQYSPARTHSSSSTLDRKSKFSRAFALSSSGTHLSQEQKENMRGEQVPVCNDCKGLVMEITRSSRQTRSSARNRTLKNLTLDLSPVYK